jgi:hypothetical protein
MNPSKYLISERKEHSNALLLSLVYNKENLMEERELQ